MSNTQRDGQFARAEQVLEEYFASAGSALSFEAFVAQHPDLASELRELHGLCADVDDALERGQETFAAQQAQTERMLASLGTTADFERRYAVEGEVGKGGMGAVYRVVDKKLDRPLAMKVILGQVEATRSGKTPPLAPRQLARFLNEARITGQLDHPGIVPVHEVGVDHEGRAYFTMKLVKGRTLGEVFQARAAKDPEWTTVRVLGVLQRVCEAMSFAHDRGVIHRDLKPANVMVGDFGEVYVMDWGLARRVGEREESAPTVAAVEEELFAQLTLTREGQLLGTPAYMSPEQARGELERIGPASDVYALGAMLYQLLAGHPPYCKPGEQPSGSAVVARILQGPPEKLVARTIPPELLAICDKAMAREPERRYASVQVLASDLQAFVAGRAVRAFRTGAWVELTKWVKRNRALSGALAAAVLAVGLGAAGIAFKAEEATQAAQRADAKAAEAVEHAVRAQKNMHLAIEEKERADREAEAARQKAEEVLQLSDFQRLVDLVAEADRLWPADPANLPWYDGWLARAREVVARLPDHRAQLAKLRERAVPLTEAEREARRRAHPRLGELALLEKKTAALRAARDVRDEKARPMTFALDTSRLPPDASDLIGLAWPLVDPVRTQCGREQEGLALARLAIERVEDDESAARAGGTLAWALFANGLDEEALQEMAAALEAVPAELRSEYQRQADELRTRIADARSGSTLSTAESELEELQAEISAADGYHFTEDQDTWWHNQLQKLVAEIEAFTDTETGLIAGISPEHGWGIERRRAFSATVAERSIEGEEAQRLWSAALASIANLKECPEYGGLQITPQLGLLPIGRDPDSGLWEFAHLMSGDPAVRGTDGKLDLREETGLVFVLLPGGTFHMGAQNRDPNGINYDPAALNDESPVHRVTLSPFFLSKYEMTQGQWLRITSRNPSNYKPGNLVKSLLSPVEQVSWTTCMEVCKRLGLSLPSEAQWEHGARASTTTVWWTGNERDSLVGAANLADQSAKQAGASWQDIKDWPELDDGNAVHASVNQFRANAFGLHNVHGNVWEWCLDGYDSHFYGRATANDPVSEPGSSTARVIRGGSFVNAASFARSAVRRYPSPEYPVRDLGIRPARDISL